jgi:hypothetical protein
LVYYLGGRTGKSARIAERRLVQRDVPAAEAETRAAATAPETSES